MDGYRTSDKALLVITSLGGFNLTSSARDKVRKYDRYNSVDYQDDDVLFRSNPTLARVIVEYSGNAFCGFGTRVEFVEVDKNMLKYMSICLIESFHLASDTSHEKIQFDWTRYISDTYPTPENITENAEIISNLLKQDLPPHRIVKLFE